MVNAERIANRWVQSRLAHFGSVPSSVDLKGILLLLACCPYVASGPLSAKLLKNGTLKTYKNFPHGMPTTEADTINSDLLAFLKR
jgi:hypothetical protein